MKLGLALAAGALVVHASAGFAAPPVVVVKPPHVQFGSQAYETLTKRSFTVTNRRSQSVLVAIELVRFGDDFSALIESTCRLIDSVTLAPGESCTQVVGFRPTPFFGGEETAIMQVVVRDLSGNLIETRDVTLTGRGY